MKAKLTIVLELPDICEKYPPGLLEENVFDDYVNYVTLSHMQDCITYAVKGEQYIPLLKHHELWADICKKAEWKVERG